MALPPPLAINKKLYSSGCSLSANISIWAGRLLPVFFSSHVVVGAICEYRRFNLVNASYTPWASATSSFELVNTYCPFLPMIRAVPVSWHIGKIPPAAILAFLSKSSATKRSLAEASGSESILESCCRCSLRR